jgi:hypothetical protein
VNFGNWNLGQWIVIGFSVFLIVWYVVAAYFNRHRGIRVYRWLREGLEEIAQDAEVHWIGSSGSGGQILFKNANAPFQSIEVVFLMETRELLPLWLFNIIRNKHDEMVFKASLLKSPTEEIEVTRQGDRQFFRFLALEQKSPYTQMPAPQGFHVAWRGRKKSQGLSQLGAFLEQHRDSIQRISLQRNNPHLVLQANLKQLMNYQAGNFFSSLQTWLGNI